MAAPKKITSAPGPTEVASWNNQIIPKGPTVVSGTPSTGFGATAGVGVNQYAQTLYNMPAAQRAVIAQSLKNAGYRGFPTNGLYNQGLANAYSSAIMAAETSAMQLGQTFDDNYFTGYLTQEIAARNAIQGEAGAGGAGGTGITEQVSVATNQQAKALIDAIFKDQFGRLASDKEVAQYTKALQKAQKKSPVVTTTTRKGDKTMISTTGGVNAQQYLLDRISGTDEGKANQVLGFYETFMKALGAN